MAKQAGDIKISGTIGQLTFYQVDGKYYVKAKSEISRARIMKDKCFTLTRRNAAWFALAQRIAAEVYHLLPKDKRSQKLVWYPLRNRAQELVRKEMDDRKEAQGVYSLNEFCL